MAADVIRFPDEDGRRPDRERLNRLLRQSGLPEQHDDADMTVTAEVEVVRHPHDPPPVLPAVVTSPLLRREALRRAGRLSAHHALRSPVYVARGTGRGIKSWSRWRRAVEYMGPMEAKPDSVEAMNKVAYHRKARTRITAGSLAGGTVSLITAEVAMGMPAPVTAGVLAYLAAAWAGRKAADGTYELPRVAQLSTDVLVSAFRLAKLIDDEETLRFAAPPMPCDGGWTAIVDLPGALTADDVIGKRVKLAGALLVDEDMLFLERVRGNDGHAARVRIWVADESPWDRVRPAFPLVSAEKWSIWDGCPLGETARGAAVSANLIWSNWAIGSGPRMGKTFSEMLVVSPAVLDPNVRLIVGNFKGSAAFKPLAKVAHVFIRNASPENLERLAVALEREVKRMWEIYDEIYDDDERYPDDKITPECPHAPTMILLDEAQEAFPSKGDSESLKQIKSRIEDATDTLARVGPAVGYMLVLASQDLVKDSIPTRITRRCGNRLAFKVANPSESYQVLGQSNTHLDASKLPGPGIGILAAADESSSMAESGPQQIMTYAINARPIFHEICERGRRLREDAGTLSGDAARRDPKLIADALNALSEAGVDRMKTEDLATALGLSKDELRTRLTAAGVPLKQMRMNGVPEWGYGVRTLQHPGQSV